MPADAFALSIVMPCYECADTLEEAVSSISMQEFETAGISYEVIMVDDGSTDGTWQLIQKLAAKDSHIRTMRHERNRGGGAARNTGIKASHGRYIFCLDSDNILAPETLPKMVEFARAQKCDGVAFHERLFFRGDDRSKYKSHWNTMAERPIVFEDIWNGSGMLLDNFVYARAAYDRTDGYPEHHGFDTQAFEMRFLGSGASVRVCPDTAFYHRQKMEKKKSYFERVYESGRFSLNYYLGCEDVIYLFSGAAIGEIMRFDIFGKASSSGENLKSFMDKLRAKDPASFLSPKANMYEKTGFEKYIADKTGDQSDAVLFCRGVYYFKQGRYAESVTCWETLLNNGNDFPMIRFNRARSLAGKAGFEPEAIEDEVAKTYPEFRPQRQAALFGKKPFVKRVISKLQRLMR